MHSDNVYTNSLGITDNYPGALTHTAQVKLKKIRKNIPFLIYFYHFYF